MANPKLKVEKRKISGRRVKKLRQKGILPANIYGKKVKSQAVQVPLKEFERVYQKAGETGVVELLFGKGKPRPVLIHNVQTHPVTDQFLHADFHQVVLTEKVTADIPIAMVGSSPAVEEKKGILLMTLDEVEVEALPADFPDKIEVDVSNLAEVDQEVRASQLKLPKKVTLLTDPNLIVCKISPLVTKEAEELAKEEEAAAEAAKEEVAKEAPPKEAPPEKAPPTVGTPRAGEGESTKK